MKVTQSLFDLTEEILNTFDAKTVKYNEIKNTETSVKTDTGNNKWENMEK